MVDTKKIAQELAAKCWGYDGYYDGPNDDPRRPWEKESLEDTRELVPLIEEEIIAAEKRGFDEAYRQAIEMCKIIEMKYRHAPESFETMWRLSTAGECALELIQLKAMGKTNG